MESQLEQINKQTDRQTDNINDDDNNDAVDDDDDDGNKNKSFFEYIGHRIFILNKQEMKSTCSRIVRQILLLL